MADFLLELRSEEIPARMQENARAALEVLFVNAMEVVGVDPRTETYATPRRLTLIARGLPLETAAVSEEIKGPKSAAPPQALEGFLRKTGLTRDQLVERDGVLFAIIDKPGRATADVLAEAIPRIIRAFPWPKSMRWGDASLSTESLRWVRPLQGIIALLDGAVVDCEVAGIASGRETVGHRFYSTGMVSIESAATYVEQLRDAHVIVDQDERANIIAVGAKMAARKAGLTLIEDAGLLTENAGLTEWPVPLLGRFDAAFLDVPPEVIQLTARVNQKYFVCADANGKLANAFICTANIDAADGGAKIVDGNRKVLAARLSDAKFFYDTDLKVPLDQQARKLDRIVFHEKLGTVADKVARLAKLARWLVEEGIVPPSTTRHPREGGDPASSSSGAVAVSAIGSGTPAFAGVTAEERAELGNLAYRAAQLCKADLVTGMVGEFPELQGLMGGYYAAAQGEDPRVAAAIRDHYKPVGQGDDVPTDPVTVAVSLADKLDTLVGFFAINEKPTGSKDPFALRRAMLGILEIILRNNLRCSIRDIARESYRILIEHMLIGHVAFARDVDKFDDQQWGSPVATESAFLKEGWELIILNGDPQFVTSAFNEEGQEEWNLQTLRDQGLVAFTLQGFLDCVNDVTEFCFDRIREREKRAGRRADLVSAVVPREKIDLLKELGLGSNPTQVSNTTLDDDIVRLLTLSSALEAFIGTADGANLLAGYKRAANILKKEGATPTTPTSTVTPAEVPGSTAQNAQAMGGAPWTPEQVRGDDEVGGVGLPYTPEPAEAALIAALDIAAPAATAAVAAEDFAAAMIALSALRAPIDAFFAKDSNVIVNDPDPDKRAARLALLARVRDAVHQVADFSKIEG